MSIEWAENNTTGCVEANFGPDYHTEILVKLNPQAQEVTINNIIFDINDIKQILAKMKELQGEKK